MASPHCSPYPDYLNLNSLLTEEQKMVQKTARDFVVKELEPIIAECYLNDECPDHLYRKFGELGLLGVNLDGYDLPGMDNICYGLVMKELERCDSGLRSFASVQSSLAMHAIHAFGSEEQKQQYLPKMGTAEIIGCFGLTESSPGSDPGAMKTRAEDKGDHWLLNGSKMWISNGNVAHIAVVWARTEQGIRGFIAPTDAEGFEARKMEQKLSLRTSVTSELYFDSVKLPKAAILPKSEGLKSALMCLTEARYGIAWGAVGAAEACFDETLNFVQDRVSFGKELRGHQLIQRKLALMLTEITAGQLLALRIGQLKDAGEVHYGHVSMGKMNNVKMALNVARTCRDMLGAFGITAEYKTMRHMCNLESVYTYEGTNDIHLLIIGNQITGVPAYGV
jgi:glutaryl-CoA dehydrogenase